MRLTPLSLSLLALCAATGATDAANPVRAAARGGELQPRSPEGSNVLLYDQTSDPAGNGVPDQDFEASFNAYDSDAADDFVVPGGATWLVDEVRTVGTTGTPGGSTVSVTFYANAAGGGDPDLPGAAVPGCSYTGLAPVDTLGSFTIALPTACALAAGTYWVGIQVNQNFASFGQHFWSNRTVQAGSESVWRNPGDGFASGCTSWQPQTVCGVGGGASPDLLFQIYGNLGGADLALTLTDAPDPVTAGTQFVYSATITNNGPSAANDVALSLPLPAGSAFVSVAATGATCTVPAVGANGTVSCTWAGTTATGGANARTATITASVPASASAGSVLSATGTASSATSDTSLANNQASTTTTVATSADMSITLTDAPDPVSAGAAITYTATATNGGPSDAQDVAISLPVPANTTLVSATGGSCVATTCTFAGPTAPGASRVATYVVNVAPAAADGSLVSATASVASPTGDGNTANNSASTTTTVVNSADVSVTLSSSAAQAVANQSIDFIATATNNGPSSAQDLQLTVALSPDLRYAAHAASAGAACTAPQVGTSGSISCIWAGATAAGSARTLTVTAYGVAEGTSSAQASASSPTTDPVGNNNAATASVIVSSGVEDIPTLDRLGLMLLAALIALVSAVGMRRQT